MAEQLAYDVTARDRATRVLGAVGKAMKDLGDRTEQLDKDSGRLADSQLKVRAAMLGVSNAEERLTAARAALSKVTKDATASDQAKRKAALAVEAAEIRHARALRSVQTEGEKAAKTARLIASAQRDNEDATAKASRAQRAFGSAAQASGKVTTAAYAGVSKTIGGVRIGVGGLFKGMALGVPVAGALGVGLLGLGKAVFDSAANMELLDRKSRVVFGRNFPEAVKWSKAVAERMGLTSREVVGLAAGVQDLLIPMGFARTTAFGMSKDIVGLSGALSQWSAGQYDASQVTDILRAAMLGERDSLQGLGISISQAQVDAQVLANKKRGVKFATDEQAQAQATLDLIYAKSTDAQKAFAGSTDTLAAKQAQAKARFGEVRDAIVSSLIPALSKLGTWFLEHQDDVINFGFQAAASVIGFGRNAGIAFGDILIGVGRLAGGLANLLDSSNTTFTGILRGAAMALRVINPEAARAATGALADFERMRRGAVDRLRAIEVKSGAAGRTLKAEVTKGSDAASAKLEQVRRAALGIPNKTLTQINVDEKVANAKIAATKRALRDPELTKTRKAKLEADLAKWEAQKKQIARDKANIAKAVYVPAGARAVPSRVVVVRETNSAGVVTGIRFGSGALVRNGNAAGGPIRGPGTGTSDSIPAVIYHRGGSVEPSALSDGEHVITAKEVDAAGGHGAVMAWRKQVLARGKAFAFGGPVADMDLAGRKRLTRAGLREAADAGLQDAVRSTVRDAIRREETAGGALGGGSVMGYQNQMAVLRRAFPGLALISGFRPGSITATGNRSYHASGRAVDIPPRMDVFNWIRSNYGARSKELIFSPAGGRQVWNGRPHMYTGVTRADHWDHVHWAMANGGVIREPVMGVGLRSGGTYSFGERGSETVTPGEGTAGGLHIHLHGLIALGSERQIADRLVGPVRAALKDRLRAEGRAALAASI